jgi:hypothetical protein
MSWHLSGVKRPAQRLGIDRFGDKSQQQDDESVHAAMADGRLERL